MGIIRASIYRSHWHYNNLGICVLLGFIALRNVYTQTATLNDFKNIIIYDLPICKSKITIRQEYFNKTHASTKYE